MIVLLWSGLYSELSFYLIFFPGLLLISSPLWGSAAFLLHNYTENDKKVKSIGNVNGILTANTIDGNYEVEIIEIVKRDQKMDIGFDFLPWSGFFYYQLKCANDRIFYVSCLNELSSELNSSKILHKKYPTIPFEEEKLNESNSDSFQTEMNLYIAKYTTRTPQELQDIVNSSKYSDAARTAAKKLLKSDVDNTV